MGVGRHERRVERAFGKNCPEMIGQPERHEKCVRDRPGAENRGQHDVAREAGQPRKERIAADGEDTTEHQRLLQHAAALQNGEIALTSSRGPLRAPSRRPNRVPMTFSASYAPSAPRTAGNDPLLRRLVEIGVHRQADDVAGQSCSLAGNPPSATGKSRYAVCWCIDFG